MAFMTRRDRAARHGVMAVADRAELLVSDDRRELQRQDDLHPVVQGRQRVLAQREIAVLADRVNRVPVLRDETSHRLDRFGKAGKMAGYSLKPRFEGEQPEIARPL